MSGSGKGGKLTSGLDPHTPEQRKRNMAAVRGRDTKPEMIVRRGLHAAGFRYRLHGALPGKPDLVFSSRRAAIFVHGCFWHGHDCPMFKIPATKETFWREKIGQNQARDAKVRDRLLQDGWRVATIWECSLRGRSRLSATEATASIAAWLNGSDPEFEIEGDWGREETHQSQDATVVLSVSGCAQSDESD